MTRSTRIYKHSSAGTDWAALALGAGLGLTLALQLTTVRLSDFNTFYSLVVSLSRLTALVGTYFAVVGMFLIARIPWAVAGGFDPSGLVKGWAADKSADMLVAAGAEHVQINAAGDLSLRGGFVDSDGVVKPWPIGVVNPNNKLEVVKIYEITDGAIATSGTYERGAHIHDPQTGMIAIGAKSATVVGPLGWLCDAMATAVMVGGTDSISWFRQSELLGYRVFGVNRHEDTAWEI